MSEITVIHVTGSMSRLGGGTFESVRYLSQETRKNGIEIEVVGVWDQFTNEDLGKWSPLPVRTFPSFGPPLFAYAPELDRYLAERDPDMVHLHGVWQYPTSAVLRWGRATGRPYLVSAHGMLEPWALKRSSFKKAAVNWLYQNAMLREAVCLRATAMSEVESYRRLRLKKPIALIRNGVFVPETLEKQKAESGKRKRSRRALFLSRIHPKKGLLDLVRAWASIQKSGGGGRSGELENRQSAIGNRQSEGWELVIIGPDEGGHLAEVMALARELGLPEQVRYGGEIWQDEAKWRCFQEADLFVLPSHSENFGLVIAEALGCGVPVITTRATPWRDLETHRCGWWIDTGEEPLARALRQAMAAPAEELRAMGARGRQLVLDKYSWAPIGRQMAETYEWLAGRRDQPACILDF